MSETSTLIGYGGRTIGREEPTPVPTPAATETHRPVPHHEIVQALVETLGFRYIGVVHDEYAVSPDCMKAFGFLDLETEMAGCRFSIGVYRRERGNRFRWNWLPRGTGAQWDSQIRPHRKAKLGFFPLPLKSGCLRHLGVRADIPDA
jgi:hypothetical protein